MQQEPAQLADAMAQKKPPSNIEAQMKDERLGVWALNIRSLVVKVGRVGHVQAFQRGFDWRSLGFLDA